MDTCRDLKVIPQYSATCWFNSILMALLYSENARKMLISNSKTWDKENKFLNILKYILKNYDKPSIEKYHKHAHPELILFEFFKQYDLKEFEIYFKKKIKKDFKDFSFTNFFLIDFIKYLNPNILDITHDNETDNNIIGIFNSIIYDLDYDNILKYKLNFDNI